MLDSVAIAVVEGERDEEAAGPGRRQPGERLVERDEVVALGPDQRQRPVEEFRRDLEQAVGLKALRPARTDMMQRQDHARALREPPAPAVGAGQRDRPEDRREGFMAQSHEKPVATAR